MEEKINEIFVQIAKLPLPMQSVSRFENCVQTLTQTVASYDAKMTNIEQIVSSVAARVTALETNATSASSGSGSARSWNILGHSDGSTATGSLGPMAKGHLMTIETQNEGLIRSQALKMNKREVPYYFDSFVRNTTKELRYGSMIFGKNPICPHTTNLSEFIARQVLCRPGLYLKHEPNVKILLLDIKMMVSSMQLTVPSAAPIPLSLSANPKQLKTEKLENNLHLCGENWLTNLKFSSLMEMTRVHSSSQRSTLARMFSASKIEEMELENRCSNLLLLEAGKHLPLFHLSCLSLVFLLKCCSVFSLKPARPNV